MSVSIDTKDAEKLAAENDRLLALIASLRSENERLRKELASTTAERDSHARAIYHHVRAVARPESELAKEIEAAIGEPVEFIR